MATTPKAIPTFQEALGWLDGFTNYERVSEYAPGPADFGTARMSELLQRLANPHRDIPVLHIVGTKGKGSVAQLTARLVTALGYRVGLYTSPHLATIRERIQLAGRPITEAAWCEAIAEIMPPTDAMRRQAKTNAPTYFEIVTALAFVASHRAAVDVIVLEVGLGGRLDATNVHDMQVAANAITTISLDHTKQLGDTILAIADEKMGIMREGIPVICAPQEATVAAAIQARAKNLGCPLVRVGEEVRVTAESNPPPDRPEVARRIAFHTASGDYVDIAFPLLGRHQLTNAATALALVECYLEKHDKDNRAPITREHLARAWGRVSLPGRLEIVGRRPWVLLDGAHNPASAWALAETLGERFLSREQVLVFSAAADKDIAGMLRILAPLFGEIILTTTDTPRVMDTAAIAALIKKDHAAKVTVEAAPVKATQLAFTRAGSEGLVCVTGSLYLVGAVRGEFVKDREVV